MELPGGRVAVKGKHPCRVLAHIFVCEGEAFEPAAATARPPTSVTQRSNWGKGTKISDRNLLRRSWRVAQ